MGKDDKFFKNIRQAVDAAQKAKQGILNEITKLGHEIRALSETVNEYKKAKRVLADENTARKLLIQKHYDEALKTLDLHMEQQCDKADKECAEKTDKVQNSMLETKMKYAMLETKVTELKMEESRWQGYIELATQLAGVEGKG